MDDSPKRRGWPQTRDPALRNPDKWGVEGVAAAIAVIVVALVVMWLLTRLAS